MMKKLTVLLITLCLMLSLIACSASGDSKKAEETASASAEQSASAGEAGSEPVSQQMKMTEYQSQFGTIVYPEIYKDAFNIKEDDDKQNHHVIAFDTQIDGKTYHLFRLILFNEAGENRIALKDNEGETHYVAVQMDELDTSGLTEEQTDKLYAMQESVNDILSNLE